MKNKKILWITASLLIIIIGTVVGFSENLNKTAPYLETPEEDTLKTNPKIDIKVNKEFDDDGNIIRYDSTYSYIYTYPNGKQESINIDSLFQSFQPYFFNRSFDLMQDPFKHFFERDSFYERHFFDHDYFMQQFEQERFKFEEMMKRMDSLRNEFLKDNFPEIQQNKTKPTKKKSSKTYEI
ncbi:MAG: hypothetical protein ACLFVR_12210 [Thiohalospira sp.]